MKRKENFIVEKCLQAFCLVGILMLFSGFALAETLQNYKEDIQHLKNDFAKLLAKETDENFEREVFEEIPELLPAEEKIEAGGFTVEVNNKWLTDEINRYKQAETAEEKKLILTAVYERLDAVELKIEELEATVERDTSKDEEKRKLAEILKREEYQKPAEEQKSLLQRFLDWLDELMRRNAPKQNPQISASNFAGVAYFLQILLYIGLGLIIIFLIYKFAPFFVKKFREREKRSKRERIILGEKIAADETTANLFNEAEKLALEGNLRDAIRKGYIAFLFELSERKMIGLARHKTNRDYLSSVRKNNELYRNMNGLTQNYERHWYGFEEADERDWQEFKANYNDALNN